MQPVFEERFAVFISGPMQTRKWVDNQGHNRYTTEVKAMTMKMLTVSATQYRRQAHYQPASQFKKLRSTHKRSLR